jgi:hypothetical protein
MLIKILLLSLLTTSVYAQERVKNPVVIRNEDFKEGTTWNEALDYVYKKIVPKKSSKKSLKCFWMLGDKQYTIATAMLPDDGLQIEPMLIEILVKPEKNGAQYLVNKTEMLSLEELKESLAVYKDLANANSTYPIIMIKRGEIQLSKGLDLMKFICDLEMKHIYIPEPIPVKKTEPLIPLPKKPLPISPHRL